MEKKQKKYLIMNYGCHSITTTRMELTDDELKFLIKFAKKNNKNSSCSCEPTIEIYAEWNQSKDLVEED